MAQRYGYPSGASLLRLDEMTRLLTFLIALTITASCGYVQMQPKSGGTQPTPYAPRLP
jgi:hypothetical protein